MATATGVLLQPFGDPLIDALTNGTIWRLDASRTIQWAVAQGFEGERWADVNLTVASLRQALDGVSYYADIKFQYMGVFANSIAAYEGGSDITLSLSGNRDAFPSINTWARAGFPYLPWETIYPGWSGDLYLNTRSQAAFLPSYAPGSAGYFLLLHELGHALGLKHPHDDGGTGRPTFAAIGVSAFDQDFASVMSYEDKLDWNLTQYDPATFMILDVIALQALYGRNLNASLGDTRFELSNFNLYATIWDAGGFDTIDTSNATSGWTIFLPFVQASPLVPELVGYALPSSDFARVAPSTFVWIEGDIEGASGSRFADSIIGNALANRLRGNGGNATIDGGGGVDVAAFAVARASATISRQGSTTLVQSIEGNDELTRIERLQFLDQILAFDADGATGQGYRLYQAAFARTPDKGGLSFWVDRLDDGASLRDVARGFVTSAEFSSVYGLNATAEQFVARFYQNVLARPGEAAGIAYWTGELARGVSVADVLVSFSESAENVDRLAPVIGQGVSLDPAAFL